jgi:polysaccharide export outer membrane protein
MKADSTAILKQAQAVKPKSLTPQPRPEAKAMPQFSPVLPPPPQLTALAQKPVYVAPIPDVSTLPIDQIVARSLGMEVSKMQAKPTSPVIAVNPLPISVVIDPPEMISQVEVTPQSLPTPATAPILAGTDPLSVPIITDSPEMISQVNVKSQTSPTPASTLIPSETDPLSVPIITDSPEMISQVEVTRQSLPTPAPTPIPYSVPSSIRTEPSVSPTDALGGASIDETYALGAGDRIQINLLNVPEYSGPQQVLADGSVNLPLIGKVSIKGMTLPVAEATIASRYEPELRHAIVTLVLVQPRPLRIAIAGEVQKPGSYTLPLAEGDQFPSIAQAIQGAGGVTQAANLHQVQVRRQQSGSSQTIMVDLWELVRNGDQNQNLALRDGDTIVIAAATEVNMAETAQLADSNLAASAGQALDVTIVGEIFRPGAYRIGAESSSGTNSDRPRVTQVIQLAGGVKPTADLRQVQVRRVTRSGAEQLINVDFWKLLQAGDSSQNLILQQGDTITIPLAEDTTAAEASQLASANLSPDTIQINVIGEVKEPGAVPLPANTTLNQALLAAGGLNDRSAREVELIRLNPNGTITQQRIKVDLREGIDAESNPILWNNDIIIAGRSRSAQLGDRLNSILGPFLQLISPIRALF